MRFTVAASFLAGSAMAGTAVPTSTDYITEMVTVTSCGPTVTDCPADSTVVSSTVKPLTTSTVYTTSVHTITSCPPNVVKCPAHSTIEVTETIPISTTVCPVEDATTTGGPWTNGTMTHTAPGTGETGHGGDNNGDDNGNGGHNGGDNNGDDNGHNGGDNGGNNGGDSPVTSEAPACPTHSVTSITKSYTTVLTTVEVSTVEVPCPTGGDNESPSASFTPPAATTTGPAGGNGGNGGCSGPECPTGGNNNGTTTQPPPVTGGAAAFTGSAVFAAVAGVAAYVLA